MDKSINKRLTTNQDFENIYENVTTNQGIKDSSGPARHSGKRVYRLVAMGLGVLCVLQVILNVYLYLITYSSSGEKDQLQNSYNYLIEVRDQLEISYRILTEEKDQLQNSYNNLIEVRDQLEISYRILTEEKDQLQNSYNNLIQVRDQLEISYRNLTEEKDNLQTRFMCDNNGTCPQDWIKSNSSCYYISLVKKTWADSRQDCLNNGADLLIIYSREEQDLIRSFNHRVWIGLTDSDVEGTWRWVDGSPVNTSYWNTGEPNDSLGKEDFAEIITTHPERGWNDVPCEIQKHWICEGHL